MLSVMLSSMNHCFRVILVASPALVLDGVALAQVCPTGATGSCTSAHSTPGCADIACCELICASDVACCTASWDAYCAFVASLTCDAPPPVPCGSPSAGSCTEPHATPSCSDAACCNTVCSFVPACCSVAWDAVCVSIADGNCATQCTPPCPPGSLAEGEECGIQGNSVCIGTVVNPSLLNLANGQSVCGKLQQLNDGSPDLDAFRFTLADPNGDGLVRLTVQYTAEYAADSKSFVALIPMGCAPLASAAHVLQMNSCGVQSLTACVASGTWIAIVGRGTFPNPTTYPLGCGNFQSYSLAVSWNDQCTNPCGTSGSCYEPHASPGCELSACCASVCAADPICCEKNWDQLCADRALLLCPPAPPANDQCVNSTLIHLGSSPFTLAGASATPLPAPAGCLDGGATALGADVWFHLRDVRGRITVSTCGASALDSVIVVYEESCGSTAIACNDDASTCPSNQLSSRVEFDALCGVVYSIRVAALPGQIGSGTLQVSSTLPACPPCPDVNGDRQVDGVDLSAVLAGWGGTTSGDIDGDGTVGGTDLTAILAGWGACPE